jgi:tRNA A-37 threonylcarbamoyl transferase component Bud32/tetratricopeptide (TPR) repeat protein
MTTSSLLDRLSAALAPDYELIRLLGEGGMASVFLAREKSLKRLVAIKVLSPELAAPAFRARFSREAETAAQLQHPNIVPIFRVGDTAGFSYYAMGYVEGESLADRLTREGRLSLEETIRIGGEVAAALGAAHRRGIIHRDVKPQNIMLEADTGRALVTDFGIARLAPASGADEDDADRLTGLGMVMGTPRYMSPEQASGERDLTPAADMYSLGIMLYEMLTGEYPYRGARGARAMMAHLTQAAMPIREVRADIPDSVADAIDALLDKNPEQRPGPAALRVAMGEKFAPPVEKTPLPSSPEPKRWGWAVAVGLVGVLAAGAALWGSKGGPPRGVDPRQSLLIGFFDNTSNDPSLDWLRLGGVDLLSQSLRRWQDLQVVEVERLLDLARRAGVPEQSRLTQEGALEMARDAGVWTATVGSIVPAEGSIRVSLNVYDVASGNQLTRATAQVATANIALAFDSLATQVLNLADVPRGALIDVEPPTRSLEAYRAYIEGIAARSRWELDSASAAFRRAIERDSTFALAYYELSQAVFVKELLSPDPTFIALSDSALRFAQGRPPRERLLIEAYNAMVHSDFPRSQALYRQLLSQDSMLADAWTGLGAASQLDMTLRRDERGREYSPTDLTLAKRSYERALSLDGSDHRVYLNLASLVAIAGLDNDRSIPGYRAPPTMPVHLVNNRFPDRFYTVLMMGDSLVKVPSESLSIRFSRATIDSLRRIARDRARAIIRQWTRIAPDEGHAYLLTAALDNLDKDYDGALGALATAERLQTSFVIPFPNQRLSILLAARRLDAAVRLGDSLDTGAQFRGNEVLVQMPVMISRLVAGKLTRARALMTQFLSAVRAVSPDSQVRRFYNLLEMVTPVRERASIGQATAPEVRAAVARLEASGLPDSGASGQFRGQLKGTLSFAAATLGDTATVARLIGKNHRPSTRALAAAMAGDRTGAERFYRESLRDTLRTAIRSYSLARTAEFLGLRAEALGHYETMDSLNYDTEAPDPDWLLLVRSYALRATAYEAAGDLARARDFYRRFVDLWSEADPSLQGEVDQARRALAELERADRGDR